MVEADTHPDIVTCFITTLTSCDPTALFSNSCSAFCRDAALVQDSIGWQNSVKGKLSTLWGALEETHYSFINSQCSSSKWSAGLVTQLLEFIHAVWLFRNSILREHNQQGLKREDALALETAIREELTLGTSGLAHRDHHYIHRGRGDVNAALSSDDKQAWLQGIRLTRNSRSSSSADLQCQQEFIESFLMS
jgi:hypothetical protein